MATLHILYGSATGNAEQIAKDLSTHTPPTPFTSIACHPLDQFKKKCLDTWLSGPPPAESKLTKHGVIIISSTTGNGDPPENASRFVRYIKRRGTVDAMPFQHCAFAVLGLGDTNYDQFCAVGKVVDKKLDELGGTRAKPLGMADEATGLEDVVEPWVDTVLGDLAKACTEDGGGQEKEVGTAAVATEKSSGAALGSAPTTASTGSANVQGVDKAVVGAAALPNGPVASPSASERPKVQADGAVGTVTASSAATTVAAPKVVEKILGDHRGAVTTGGSSKSDGNAGTTDAASRSTKSDKPSAEADTTATSSSSPLFILYGSETGNAEHIAKDLASTYESILSNPDTRTYFKSVICCELNQYKKKCASHWETEPPVVGTKHGVIVVISTTGNGDAPENASRFVRYIKRKNTVESMPFRHCAYAVLGLGDTNYDQFSNSGKIVDRKLSELGGKRAKALGMADEATGLEDVVEPWVNSVFQDITNACNGSGITGSDEKKDVTVRKSKTEEGNEPRDEEKKTDVADAREENKAAEAPLPQAPKPEKESTTSPGVQTLLSLLSLNTSSSTLPTVQHCDLPTLGASLSSCELIHHSDEDDATDNAGPRSRSRGMSLSEMDRMTVSTSSTSNIHYTISNPYVTTVLGARYLTKTDVDGAKMACEIVTNESKSGGSEEEDERERLIQAMDCYHEHFPLCPSTSNDDATPLPDETQYEKNGKRVIELTLTLPDDYTLEYQPGDSLGVLIPNTPHATNFILNMLREQHGIMPNHMVSFDAHHPIPVSEAVRDKVDLCSPIKNRRILHTLSQHATDPNEECALRLLASKTDCGTKLFEQYIDEQRMNVVDILQQFPSCQCVPMEGLLGMLPSIAPRYYSVTSSPLAKKKDELSLTVAFSVVDYLTPNLLTGQQRERRRRRIGGLATRYLETICSPFLCNHDTSMTPIQIKIFPKPTSEFHLPTNLSTPLILIGPGTGVAPYMGFLSHRHSLQTSLESTQAASVASEGTWRGGYELEEGDLSITKRDARGLKLGVDFRHGQSVGDVDLYFGCRHSNHDWLYKDEMLEFEKEGIVTNLRTAFSRDGNKGKERVYVQSLMKEDAQRLVDMIMDKRAAVYVCGDGNAMGKEVMETIVEMISSRFDVDVGVDAKVKAKAYFDEMKVQGRFLMDIWS